MLRVLRRRGDAKLLAFAAQMVATGAMTTGVCALGQVCERLVQSYSRQTMANHSLFSRTKNRVSMQHFQSFL